MNNDHNNEYDYLNLPIFGQMNYHLAKFNFYQDRIDHPEHPHAAELAAWHSSELAQLMAENPF
jgi:hypothetical protein